MLSSISKSEISSQENSYLIPQPHDIIIFFLHLGTGSFREYSWSLMRLNEQVAACPIYMFFIQRTSLHARIGIYIPLPADQVHRLPPPNRYFHVLFSPLVSGPHLGPTVSSAAREALLPAAANEDVIETTGSAGDVLLTHPLLLHARYDWFSKNVFSKKRLFFCHCYCFFFRKGGFW